MTAEQVEEVLTKAALDATGQASLTDDQKIVGSKAQCDEFMDTLRGASESVKASAAWAKLILFHQEA
ncbi:hypothetical protein [Shimia sp.]|uniref:hypothetical protein n=1 Tax=Shimia sp. TaxID=1954381 RepID=UPI003298B1D7